MFDLHGTNTIIHINIRLLSCTACFNKMDAFGQAKAAALAELPSDSDGRQKAKARARAKFAELDILTVAIDKEVAKPQSGGKPVGTTSRGILRDALAWDLREWSRTAAAITEELKRPEIMAGFRPSP